MEALLFITLVVLFIRWLVIRSRLRALESRILLLEQKLAGSQAQSAAPAPAPVYAPAPVPQFSFCEWCGRRLEPLEKCHCREVPAVEPPAPRPVYMAPEPVPSPVPAGPTLAQRLREKMGGEEWEALVGGSLLNKIGVLILVIGVALFLGYSFTQLRPAGRAAVGLAVSLAMLVGGFFVDRKQGYRVFATGLLGGGWAALYFTTYAIHAIEATRIIDSPIAGGVLLFAVACGMIAHSLRYSSQTLTGLAYFIAFATLAITPVTTLSVLAIIPLALSLLYIAHRFAWSGMALFGLLATWGTLVSRGDSGAPAWQAQALFTIYWILFEAFDILRAARRTKYAGWELALHPLNAVAFATLSYMKWRQAAPDSVYLVAAAVAAAYYVSAAIRARLRPLPFLSGGYEGPITVAAILSAAAVLLHFHGAAAGFGLIAEAEALYLTGLYFKERYPRWLAAGLFGTHFVTGGPVHAWPTGTAAGLFYLNRWLERPSAWYGYAASATCLLLIGLNADLRYLGIAWFALGAALFAFGWIRRLEDFRFQGYGAAAFAMFGLGTHQAQVAAGFAPAPQYPWLSLAGAAALAYAGVWTALKSGDGRLHPGERTGLRSIASWAVTALLAALAWRVVPRDYLGLAWLVLAVPVLELGLRQSPREFKAQAYALAALGSAAVLLLNLVPMRNDGPLHLRLVPLEAGLTAYLLALRLYKALQPRHAVTAVSAAGSLFTAAAMWALLPAPAVAPAWVALAVLLAEAGIGFNLEGLVLQSHLVSAASLGRVFMANLDNDGAAGAISHRLASTLPVAAAFYHLWSRLGERRLARYYSWAGTLVVFALMRFEFGRQLTAAGWAVLMAVLIGLARRWSNQDLRWQAYAVAAAAFARNLFSAYDESIFEGPAMRIATSAIVIACLYGAQLLAQGRARTYFSMLGTVLATVVLYREVSGGMLTVAWGIEGIALLIAGFPLRDRVLRLSGLALFLICVLKLFVYDLRNLETGYRILSFIVLGLMLVGVSWIYTRFRGRIQQYL